MWLILAIGSAVFAALTSILAKIGIDGVDSTLATAIRTVVVVLLSWGMVFITNTQNGVFEISKKSWIFLILSGLATGLSWLCYYKAIQVGSVSKVVPIDKSSIVLTIILAFIFLHESVSLTKAVGVVLIGAGTFLMIERKDAGFKQKEGKNWLLYALGSAVFASLTSILGKIGISNVESNLGTAIRTCVVLLMAWVMVFVTGKQHTIRTIEKKELVFICLSGIATGASWMCYYKALQDGLASVVVPIDKLSVLVTVVFSYIVFHEKLSKKSGVGLISIIAGTLVMLIQ